jgi:hypothetical protein
MKKNTIITIVVIMVIIGGGLLYWWHYNTDGHLSKAEPSPYATRPPLLSGTSTVEVTSTANY